MPSSSSQAERDRGRAPRVPMGCRWMVLVLVVCGAQAWPTQGVALRLHVRARAQVEAHVFARAGEVVVRGQLTDARGRGIANAAVNVTLAAPVAGPMGTGRHAQVTTRRAGRFEAVFPRAEVPLRALKVRLRATYAGDPSYGSAQVDRIAPVDKPRADVEVEVRPAVVSSDLSALAVSVYVGVAGVPLGQRAVRLAVDQVALPTLETGPEGWAEARVPLAKLLPAGLRTLSATVPDGAHVAGRTVRVPLDVRMALGVDLRRSERACPDDATCVEGEVRVHVGGGQTRPARNATVTLHADRTRLGSIGVEADGRFAARLRGDVLAELFAPGAIGVVAEARVPAPFHDVGWSPVLAVDVPPPTSPSEWIYVALLVALALGLAWRRWRDLVRERTLLAEQDAAAAGLPARQVRHVGDGDAGHVVRGCVLHGETGAPTAAVVVAQGPEAQRLVEADDHGRFDFGALRGGAWTLRVEAPEHEPLQVALTVPHDGTYDGCELLPRSCRAVARGRFAATVAHHTGRTVDWLRETPALVEPRWMRARRRGHGAIREAVDAADVALYGRKTDADALERLDAALGRTEEGA